MPCCTTTASRRRARTGSRGRGAAVTDDHGAVGHRAVALLHGPVRSTSQACAASSAVGRAEHEQPVGAGPGHVRDVCTDARCRHRPEARTAVSVASPSARRAPRYTCPPVRASTSTADADPVPGHPQRRDRRAGRRQAVDGRPAGLRGPGGDLPHRAGPRAVPVDRPDVAQPVPGRRGQRRRPRTSTATFGVGGQAGARAAGDRSGPGRRARVPSNDGTDRRQRGRAVAQRPAHRLQLAVVPRPHRSGPWRRRTRRRRTGRRRGRSPASALMFCTSPTPGTRSGHAVHRDPHRGDAAELAQRPDQLRRHRLRLAARRRSAAGAVRSTCATPSRDRAPSRRRAWSRPGSRYGTAVRQPRRSGPASRARTSEVDSAGPDRHQDLVGHEHRPRRVGEVDVVRPVRALDVVGGQQQTRAAASAIRHWPPTLAQLEGLGHRRAVGARPVYSPCCADACRPAAR